VTKIIYVWFYEYFMKEFYNEYDRMIRLACPCYDYCLNLMVENIPSEVSSVLDLGSGTGNLISSILRSRARIKIYGIELQKNLVAIAKAKIRKGNVVFLQRDILNFDWPKADCVCSSLVIHHLTHNDKERVFRKIHEGSKSFLYFDRLKGKSAVEETVNQEYLFSYMRKNGLSERVIEEGKSDMRRNDKPLKVKELNCLLASIGFDFSVLYLEKGFGVYLCTRNE